MVSYPLFMYKCYFLYLQLYLFTCICIIFMIARTFLVDVLLQNGSRDSEEYQTYWILHCAIGMFIIPMITIWFISWIVMNRFAFSMKFILITHIKHRGRCSLLMTWRYATDSLCPRLTSSFTSIPLMPFLGSLMPAWWEYC